MNAFYTYYVNRAQSQTQSVSAPNYNGDINGIDYSDPALESLWEVEFNVLQDMGFTDRKTILPLLNKHLKGMFPFLQ